MATRAIIHFGAGTFGTNASEVRPDQILGENEWQVPIWSDRAIVYRHWDGDPDNLGHDIMMFLNYLRFKTATKKGFNNRFTDPEYLATKWIVYDVLKNCTKSAPYGEPDLMDFSGIGISTETEWSDVDYNYYIHCDLNGEHGMPICLVYDHMGLVSQLNDQYASLVNDLSSAVSEW